MAKNRAIIALILAILVTILGASISYAYTPHAINNAYFSKLPEVVFNVTVIIDYGNGTAETHLVHELHHPNVTVFRALLAVANVSFRYYGDLVFVEAINGVWNNENNNGKYWQYWIDGEYGKVAANKCILKNCSVVEWRYVESQFRG